MMEYGREQPGHYPQQAYGRQQSGIDMGLQQRPYPSAPGLPQQEGVESPQRDRAPSVHSNVNQLIDDQSQQVQIFLSVRNIPKLDTFSPSDPFIVVSTQDNKTKRWTEIHFTEIVWDNHNADFVKRFTMQYIFEEVQNLRFTVLDADAKDANRRTGKDREGVTDFIGTFTCTLAELVTRKDKRLETKMKDRRGRVVHGANKRHSSLIIRTEEVSDCQDVVLLQLSGRGLPKMDVFGRADPFLQFYRATEDGRWAAVAKTEYHKRTYNPDWKPMLIKVQQLCNGDYNRPIMIRCFDWNANDSPDFMGEIETSLDQLLLAERPMTFKRKNKPRKTYGTLVVRKRRLRQQHSFIEYIRAGLDIQLMVAIDFTASNGDPRDKASLHYLGRQGMEFRRDNDYLQAIKAVGAVLEPYDDDGMIPVWGFGAKLQRGGPCNHCFPLTMDNDNIEVRGVDGIVEAYRNVLPRVTLSGPTLLAQTMQTALSLSTEPFSAQSQHYTILLIITDGVINDKQASTDTIVHCTDYPMSIIICGVGSADFSTMEYLDADDEPLISTEGVKMKRDIVQFVPFNEFKNSHPTLFSKEVLAEIPDQVTSYMAQHNFKPLNWQARPEEVQRMRRYNSQASISIGPGGLGGGVPLEGAGGDVISLDSVAPRRDSADDLMDQLGAGALQDRPYYTKTSGGRVKGVNTGHEDDYLYESSDGCSCTIL